MGERVVQPVQIQMWACANPDCDLVGAELEIPSKVAAGQLLAYRPVWVCVHCEWDLQRLPDRPHHFRFTDSELAHLRTALGITIDEDTADSSLDHATLLRLQVMFGG